MGSTKPKPDYVAGLSDSAFSQIEREEIKELHDTRTPIWVSPGIVMPFLICEAKSGFEELAKAGMQNLHAGAIIVRAMYDLYKASDLDDLDEQILVWTIDMNHENVCIYGHYGKREKGELHYYRHRFKDVRLRKQEERFFPYNFVRNIYRDFVPIHLARVKKALSRHRKKRLEAPPTLRPSDTMAAIDVPETFTETALLSQQVALLRQLNVQLVQLNVQLVQRNEQMEEEMKSERNIGRKKAGSGMSKCRRLWRYCGRRTSLLRVSLFEVLARE